MITPLRCGVDTLEATFDGVIDAEMLEDLKVRKERARAQNESVAVMLGGETYHVLPKGAGRWPYVARNDFLIVRLGGSGNIPAMQVRLLAYGLAQVGVEGLWSQVQSIADDLGLTFKNCSRLDIATDYQGDWFTFEEMLNVVCPSSFRPVYPNTVNPQTYQFGKGEIVVRVYDKTAENKANDHLWWVFVWRLCSGYRESEPVYRVEVQMRGAVLRELGFRSVESLISSLPDLFDYGLRWCSLRTPISDSNKSRWPEDERWTELRKAFAPARTLGRMRPIRSVIDYHKGVKRFTTLMVSLGVSMGCDDYWHLARTLTADAEQLIEGEMETTYPALVEKKRKQKYL